jgi:hypothetical protein
MIGLCRNYSKFGRSYRIEDLMADFGTKFLRIRLNFSNHIDSLACVIYQTNATKPPKQSFHEIHFPADLGSVGLQRDDLA